MLSVVPSKSEYIPLLDQLPGEGLVETPCKPLPAWKSHVLTRRCSNSHPRYPSLIVLSCSSPPLGHAASLANDHLLSASSFLSFACFCSRPGISYPLPFCESDLFCSSWAIKGQSIVRRASCFMLLLVLLRS